MSDNNSADDKACDWGIAFFIHRSEYEGQRNVKPCITALAYQTNTRFLAAAKCLKNAFSLSGTVTITFWYYCNAPNNDAEQDFCSNLQEYIQAGIDKGAFAIDASSVDPCGPPVAKRYTKNLLLLVTNERHKDFLAWARRLYLAKETPIMDIRHRLYPAFRQITLTMAWQSSPNNPIQATLEIIALPKASASQEEQYVFNTIVRNFAAANGLTITRFYIDSLPNVEEENCIKVVTDLVPSSLISSSVMDAINAELARHIYALTEKSYFTLKSLTDQ